MLLFLSLSTRVFAEKAFLSAPPEKTFISAPPLDYAFDQTYSKVYFTIKYVGMALLTGHFEHFYGTFHYDPLQVEGSRVKMAIQASSIESGNPAQNEKLKSKDFFWAEKFPAIIFSSKEAKENKDGTLSISGDLTIKGITKPAIFMAKLKGTVRDAAGPPRLTFTAFTVIQRVDYQLGISLWDGFSKLALEELKITLELQGVPKS